MEPEADPVTGYCQSVASGQVVAGRGLVLSCRRHLRDLDTGPERGLYWDLDRALRACDFLGMLPHVKGRWAKQRELLTLGAWQVFMVGCIFGWVHVGTGLRRFRTAYLEMARKNGKTTLAAGLGLLGAFFDQEEGAEGYFCATKRDQAKIGWDIAKQMVLRTKGLRRRLRVYRSTATISQEETGSKLEALGSREDTLDGLNPHVVVIDELHAHRTPEIVDLMDTATGAREQPLLIEITTAGIDRPGVYQDHHRRSWGILEGTHEADDWFACIAAVDGPRPGEPGDDWRDQATWAKANPNLGISPTMEYLQKQLRKALQVPTFENEFRRLHLGQVMEQAERWIPIHRWDACATPVPEEEISDRYCWAGLDLSSKLDITALVLVFPLEDGSYAIVPRFWVPEERADQRSRDDRVPYLTWIEQGFLEATPGNVVDYAFIEAAVRDAADRYSLVEVAYDPWNATQMAVRLQEEGIQMVEFRQGFRSMSEPCKELEKLWTSGKLCHGGHPVLRWMAGNVAIQRDPAGNIKVAKDKSTEKVDGIVALAMGLGRALVDAGDGSAYRERGVLTV